MSRPLELVEEWRARGWWGDGTLSQVVADHAAANPEGIAFVGGDDRLTWRAYDTDATRIASGLAARGFPRGAMVGVLLPDGPEVHVVFVACERAGLVVVGIGPRAGEKEVEHLLGKTSAVALVTMPDRMDAADRLGIPALTPGELREAGGAPLDSARAMRADELFLVNSTSGTTGLPKVVMHSQARWFYFHELAVRAAAMTPGDVFMSAIPAPFGFGLWTAHFTPAILGSPCVVMPRFSPAGCIDLIERERVSILSCVSTQFIMMLNDPSLDRRFSALRAMFTGGEMVPYDRAAEWEERAGGLVLQFYGSNETGVLSGTNLEDDREQRLATAGRIIPEMQVRLFTEDRADVTDTGGPAIAACLGPANCFGYYGDDAANDQLFTDDGWMLSGDIVTIDGDGYLTVAGRASDFIIRGGKNISAAVVEDEVATHPAVAMAAAVAMPDPVFGERVCVYVVLADGGSAIELDDVTAHLADRGLGKESWPERLVIVEELPRSSGGKIAKGELRADIRRRLEVEAAS